METNSTKNTENVYESQRKQIRKYLEAGGEISQLEALRLFGCFRLSAIIFILKNEDGLNISSRWDTNINENGQTKRFKVYFIEK